MPDEKPVQNVNDEASPAATPSARPRRRWLRRLLWSAGLVVVVLVVLVALLPTLLSTGPGTRFAAGLAQRGINGNVKIDDLDIGWFSGTTARGVVVEDAQGVRVVDASLQSDLTVLGMLRGVTSGNLQLSDTIITASLPSVKLYPDDSTSLDRLVASDDDSESTMKVFGNFKIARFDATVQKVDAQGQPLRNERDEPTPFVSVDVTDGLVTLDGDAISNEVPMTVSINGSPAGSLAVKGTADAAEGAADQRITLKDVNLAALATVAEAFGEPLGLDVAGVASGDIAVDTASGKAAGTIIVDELAIAPTDGTGYSAARVTLAIDGQTDGRQTLSLTTPDGKATVSAVASAADFAAASESDTTVGGPIASLRDIEVEADFPYAKVNGGGASIGGLDITFSVDSQPLQAAFNDFVAVNGLEYGGTMEGRLRTRVMNGSLAARLVSTVSQLLVNEPDAQPLKVDRAELVLVFKPQPNGTISDSIIDLTVYDAGEEVAVVQANIASLEGKTQSVESIDLTRVELVDYARAKDMLGGFAQLPELESDLGPIALTGTVSFDGSAGTLTIESPVVFTSDGNELAKIEGTATMPEVGPTSAALQVTVTDVAAARPILKSYGIDAPTDLGGSISIVTKMNLDTSGETMTADGNIDLTLQNVVLPGANVNGSLRLLADGEQMRVAEAATPLTLNGGSVTLDGAIYDLASSRLELQAGPLVSGVSLNPVLADTLGQYISPFLTEPESADGLLDIGLASATRIDLTDPKASDLTATFGIRNFSVTNDAIAQLADNATGQIREELLKRIGPAGRIPGLNLDDTLRDKVDLGDDLRRELGTIRGAIVDSRLTLRNGVVSTTLTINARDPRAKRADDESVYPLTFTGDVNVETFALSTSATVPVELIEKWSGESPSDLVKLVGDRPFRKIAPDGVKLAFGGTTQQPTIDVRNSIAAIAPRFVSAVLDNAGGNLLQDGLRGLFK